MGAIVRLFNQSSSDCLFESNMFSATFTRGLSKSIQWNVSLPLTSQLYDLLTDSLRAEISYDGIYGISGRVQEITVSYDLDPSIELVGREEIDEMYDINADTSLYIDDKLFVLQLFDLLDKAGWRFGLYRDIDITRLVTLDLRTQKQLLTQFSELIKQAPDLQYRYGGTDYTGQYLLDVAIFDEAESATAQMAPNRSYTSGLFVQKVQTQDKFTDRIYAAEILGGNVTDSGGVKRTILLRDALVNAPALMLDSDFPIYETLTEISFAVIPSREGGVGGKVRSVPSGVTGGFVGIGEASGAGTQNRWSSFIFHPIPGDLTECSFWLVTVSAGLIAAQASNPFLWELRLVDESNVLTISTLVASGTVPAGTWGANQRVRLVFPTAIPVEDGQRYNLRVGFATTPANNDVAQVSTQVANLALTFRYDYSLLPSSPTNTSLNRQPVFEAITVPNVSRKGMWLTDTQTRFSPQKTEGNATLAETNAAGAALYAWTVSTLEARNLDLHTISADAMGTDFTLKPGDNIAIRAKSQFIDGARDEWETRSLESVQYNFKDSKIETLFKFKPNRPETESGDETIALYEEQKSTTQTPEGKLIPPAYAWALTELTEIVQNSSANTTLSDGTRAVLVTFTVPPAPAGLGETRLLGTPYATHSNVLIPIVVEIVQKPTAESPTTLICKIGIRNAGWSLYEEAVVTAHIAWR